jgi:hypothetical protein
VFEIPTAFPELGSDEIEQLRMRGELALRTEVIQCGTESRAKELCPQPVHHRSRFERVRI